MFKRKNVVIAFLLVAVLVMSVGFAAVSVNLKVNAKATTGEDALDNAFESLVGFTASQLGTCKGATVTGNEATYDYENEVSFTASGFAKKGDTAVVVFTVTNDHPDLAADLSAISVTPADNVNFKATAELSANELAADGGTATVTVTVEMIETPTADVTVDFVVGFTATAK